MSVATLADREGSGVETLMDDIGRRARAAAHVLATAGAESKRVALVAAADAIANKRSQILTANVRDLDAAKIKGISKAFLDRLELNDKRIDAIIDGLRTIAEIPDPIGTVMAEWDRPNGLHIQ